MKREEFIRAASMLASSFLLSRSMANNFEIKKLNIGLIGANGMGWSDLEALLKDNRVQCRALADVDESVLDRRAKELIDRGVSVRTYVDYRQLLNDPDIDAVIIGTPDHWHCLQLVDALAAGKHVYVEKPIGNSIKECEVMVAATKKYNRIVQVGQWQRSQQHFRDAVDFVHSGKLGKIRLVKAWSYVGWKSSVPKKPDSATPPGVHYDLWLGPAQKRPFNPNRFHFEFRWFWDYAGGLMTDWGVHMLDYALLGMKVDTPKSIVASGGKFAFPDDATETPDTLTAIYEFDGFNVQWEHTKGIYLGPYGKGHGVAFIGENGTLVLNRDGWEVIPEGKKMQGTPFQKSLDNGLERHMVNFVDAIIQNNPNMLNAPIEAGAHIAVISQMGNIAYRMGQKIYWDKERRRFTDSQANKYLSSKYHNGYQLPKI